MNKSVITLMCNCYLHMKPCCLSFGCLAALFNARAVTHANWWDTDGVVTCHKVVSKTCLVWN